MNQSQIILLAKAKKLIREGKRRFANRADRDYVEELLNLGLTEETAWVCILGLNQHFYFPDPRPSYSGSNEVLTFKKTINGEIAYIKIKVEKSNKGEETVCLSFHRDLKT